MKQILLCNALFGLSFLSLATHAAAPLNAQSPNDQQVGYSYGYVMGRSNAETLKGLNLERFFQGLGDGIAEKQSPLSDEQMATLLNQFKKTLEAKQLIDIQKQAQSNGAAGSAFLAQNASVKTVKSTASGLQYQVLQAGTGQSPTLNSKVKVNYEGRLLDNTVFDSSIARDQPVELDLSQTIVGLLQGLQTMKEGGKSRFFIPAKLAYGEMGSGDRVPPNSTVIFDVELLQVLPAKR